MAKDEKASGNASRKIILIAANVLLILGLAAFGAYFFKKYQDLKNHPVSADTAAQAEIDRTIANVSKLYGSLPKNEKPSVATVKDKAQLKDQPFFDKAQNGDITLIYKDAKLAILYRPSSNQLINVSTVSVQSNPVVKVLGSAAQRTEASSKISAALQNAVTVREGGEAKGTYTAPMVVDLKGTNGETAAKLAAALKGQVGTLPAEEEKPTDADLLVITAPVTTP